jgi:hypothetical protein
MRKSAFIIAALLALLVLPALALFGPGSAAALAKDEQKEKAAATKALGGLSGTVTSVQNGLLTVMTAQNKQVQFSIDSYTLVLKGGTAPASALRAGDRVLVNPNLKPISNSNGKTKPATEPRDDKSATRPAAGNGIPGHNGNGNGSESGAAPAAGDRGAAPGQQANSDDKGVPAGAASRPDPANNSNTGAAGQGRETPGKTLGSARLVWVQQSGETLLYGLVRSVSGGSVVLKTGAQTQATVQVSASTVYARQMPQGAATSKAAGKTELKQGSHVVVVASGHDARVVLYITPPANANSNAGGEKR